MTNSAAIEYPAPPRFSTMTLCFHVSDSRWATARVSTSVNAPAAEVTTMVTLRSGYVCARAAGLANRQADRKRRLSRSVIAASDFPLLVVFVAPPGLKASTARDDK